MGYANSIMNQLQDQNIINIFQKYILHLKLNLQYSSVRM
jgi:hypothetical protein